MLHTYFLSLMKPVSYYLFIITYCSFFPFYKTNYFLQIMSNHCRDPAVSVRKQMIQSLTDLLCLYPDYVFLQKIFVGSVLPQISDPEIKVQEKVLEVILFLFLSHKNINFSLGRGRKI